MGTSSTNILAVKQKIQGTISNEGEKSLHARHDQMVWLDVLQSQHSHTGLRSQKITSSLKESVA